MLTVVVVVVVVIHLVPGKKKHRFVGLVEITRIVGPVVAISHIIDIDRSSQFKVCCAN